MQLRRSTRLKDKRSAPSTTIANEVTQAAPESCPSSPTLNPSKNITGTLSDEIKDMNLGALVDDLATPHLPPSQAMAPADSELPSPSLAPSAAPAVAAPVGLVPTISTDIILGLPSMPLTVFQGFKNVWTIAEMEANGCYMSRTEAGSLGLASGINTGIAILLFTRYTHALRHYEFLLNCLAGNEYKAAIERSWLHLVKDTYVEEELCGAIHRMTQNVDGVTIDADATCEYVKALLGAMQGSCSDASSCTLVVTLIKAFAINLGVMLNAFSPEIVEYWDGSAAMIFAAGIMASWSLMTVEGDKADTWQDVFWHSYKSAMGASKATN